MSFSSGSCMSSLQNGTNAGVHGVFLWLGPPGSLVKVAQGTASLACASSQTRVRVSGLGLLLEPPVSPTLFLAPERHQQHQESENPPRERHEKMDVGCFSGHPNLFGRQPSFSPFSAFASGLEKRPGKNRSGRCLTIPASLPHGYSIHRHMQSGVSRHKVSKRDNAGLFAG